MTGWAGRKVTTARERWKRRLQAETALPCWLCPNPVTLAVAWVVEHIIPRDEGGDLTDPTTPRKIWDSALDRLGGRIDALVNNAGIYEAIGEDASDSEWHAAWDRYTDQQHAV